METFDLVVRFLRGKITMKTFYIQKILMGYTRGRNKSQLNKMADNFWKPKTDPIS